MKTYNARTLVLTLAAAVAFGMTASASAALLVNNLNPGAFTDDNAAGYSGGYEFTTTSTITVNALGYYDFGSTIATATSAAGDGFTDPITVKLYDSSAVQLGNTVTLTSADTLINDGGLYGARFGDLAAPLTLPAGTYRLVGGAVPPTVETPIDQLNPITYQASSAFAAGTAFVTNYFFQGATVSFPNQPAGPGFDQGFFGPTLEFNVPEPTCLAMLSIGSLLLLRRRQA